MNINIIDKKLCKSILNIRNQFGNKGTFGRANLIVGSEEYPGAGVMSSIGALRSGAGIVSLVFPDCLKHGIPFNIFPEIILNYAPSKNGGFDINKDIALKFCEPSNSVLIGSGWGKSKERLDSVINIIQACKKRLIIDADGLNMLAEKDKLNILNETEAEIVITPHIGEMARLCKKSINQISENQSEFAAEFAVKYGITVVLKSYYTVVASKNGTIYINKVINSGLAKGGSGDLLAGLIAGLAASNCLNENIALNSAICGVYLHSMAGCFAKEEIGEDSMFISEVADYIPKAFKLLRS